MRRHSQQIRCSNFYTFIFLFNRLLEIENDEALQLILHFMHFYLGLPGNWFWRVESVGHKFYFLVTGPKGSSLERFPMLSKKKKVLLSSVGIYSHMHGCTQILFYIIICLC